MSGSVLPQRVRAPVSSAEKPKLPSGIHKSVGALATVWLKPNFLGGPCSDICLEDCA